MENRSLVIIVEYLKEKIFYFLEMVKEFEKKFNCKILDGKVVVIFFFEFFICIWFSFEIVVNRLGVCVIGFIDFKVISFLKGEILKDIIMMVSNYVDIIVMCYFLEGVVRYVSEVVSVFIVNVGDGVN